MTLIKCIILKYVTLVFHTMYCSKPLTEDTLVLKGQSKSIQKSEWIRERCEWDPPTCCIWVTCDCCAFKKWWVCEIVSWFCVFPWLTFLWVSGFVWLGFPEGLGCCFYTPVANHISGVLKHRFSSLTCSLFVLSYWSDNIGHFVNWFVSYTWTGIVVCRIRTRNLRRSLYWAFPSQPDISALLLLPPPVTHETQPF